MFAGLAVVMAQAQPALQRFTLPGGLPVALREDPSRMLFRARLRLSLRPGDLPAGREGLVQLFLRMMDRGQAGHLRPAAFDRALDEGGIQLTRRLSAEAITWDLVCRNRDQDRALSLLADRVLRTILDPQALEPERLACWREALQAQAAPEQSLPAALGLSGPVEPTELGLGRIGFADLEAFRDRAFRPDRAVLVLEGDLGPEQARSLALLAFGPWSAPAAPAPPPPPAPTPSAPPAAAPGLLAGPLPRAELALPPPPGLSPALRDLVRLRLAGDPSLAGDWLPPEPDGTLRLRAFPGTGGSGRDALAALQARLAAIRQRGAPAADLERAKLAWAGAIRVQSLHPAAQLDRDTREVLGEAATAEAVAAVTADQLQDAVQRWLAPSAQRAVVVGPTP